MIPLAEARAKELHKQILSKIMSKCFSSGKETKQSKPGIDVAQM